MQEFQIERTLEPSAAPTWFARWSKVADDPDLAFVFGEQPLSGSGLVLLGAMASDRRSRGLRNFVGGARADDRLMSLSVFEPPDQARHSGPTGDTSLLRPISTLAIARELADIAADLMMAIVPPVSPSIVRMARFVFEELGANIVQHSGRSQTGFGFIRVDPARRRLELAFADCGVGFRASLQRNPELEGRVADDAEALQLAMSRGITGTQSPRKNMGIGLRQLTEFSDLLGGDLWVASGSAMLQRKTTAGQRTDVIRPISSWPGTWICLDAPVT